MEESCFQEILLVYRVIIYKNQVIGIAHERQEHYYSGLIETPEEVVSNLLIKRNEESQCSRHLNDENGVERFQQNYLFIGLITVHGLGHNCRSNMYVE